MVAGTNAETKLGWHHVSPLGKPQKMLRIGCIVPPPRQFPRPAFRVSAINRCCSRTPARPRPKYLARRAILSSTTLHPPRSFAQLCRPRTNIPLRLEDHSSPAVALRAPSVCRSAGTAGERASSLRLYCFGDISMPLCGSSPSIFMPPPCIIAMPRQQGHIMPACRGCCG